MEYSRTFRVDRLYHQFIKPRSLSIDVNTLASDLHIRGFIKLLTYDRYLETAKLTERKHNKELYAYLATLRPKSAPYAHANKRALAFLLVFIGLAGSGCQSTPKPQGFILPVALSETFRGGSLKGLESNTNGDLGIPDPYDMVSHVCVSNPIYDFNGNLVRTSVRCW
jgi:hypothetical protein